ncbi:phosphonate ABC transporter, permease protein PhnE [Azoarcus taiwanensis]|uniref:Phosphonate ABC transporter, permease protein PhnE n=1 Tax=Azoarcus taiwanensis TaxID=666964 RepID=A0A972F988_9RHOO|nr:phosphonate ABC transporter, permease protein PhnE [Azoarcus taiwanensis]NMG04452.1 phosphonate ABC transporter, permease protein PhnE [Azoarcus taiwanensis]
MRIDIADITPDRVAALRASAPQVFGGTVASRLASQAVWAGLIVLAVYCLVRFDFSPVRLWNGLGQLGAIIRHMFPPQSGGAFMEFAGAILQTLGMAFLGTLFAALFAIPLAFLGSKNILRFSPGRFLVRRGMDFLRGVDQLIWALIFVRAVGLGPLAGILAIIVSDTGTLAKLFSESIENVDRKPVEGVRANGGDPVQTIRYGFIPQVLPMFLSSTLYMFESNVRSATILGIVGAGGIGYHLAERIRSHRWEEACLILIMILVTVGVIDFVSKRLRQRLIGKATH